jgi:Domain of unknown function (DUF4160)
VKRLVIFLNELSFESENPLSPEALLEPVLSTLAAIRAAKRMRDDLVVVGNVGLSGVVLGEENHSLGEILRGDEHRDEWRFLRSLDQASPWDAYLGTMNPGTLQEVKYQGRTAVGMLWARQNESSIVSFAYPPNWGECQVSAQLRVMDLDTEVSSTECQIPNLSKPEHVATRAQLIANYGKVLSPSSLVYEGNGFAIRMFSNDHNPPHFHVYRPQTTEVLARYTVQTLDLLSGEIASTLGRRVKDWARGRKVDLMGCWDRCRAGEHPLRLAD